MKELDVDGHVDSSGVIFIGKARLQPDGTWRATANVHGRLCIVECWPDLASMPIEAVDAELAARGIDLSKGKAAVLEALRRRKL